MNSKTMESQRSFQDLADHEKRQKAAKARRSLAGSDPYAAGFLGEERLNGAEKLQWEAHTSTEDDSITFRLKPMTANTQAHIDLDSLSKLSRQIAPPSVRPPDFNEGVVIGQSGMVELASRASTDRRQAVRDLTTEQNPHQPGPDLNAIDQLSSFWVSLPEHAREALLIEAEINGVLQTAQGESIADWNLPSQVESDNVDVLSMDGNELAFVVEEKERGSDSEIGSIRVHVDLSAPATRVQIE